MININLTIIFTLIHKYIFPITRITTFFVSSPIFGNNVVTKPQKLYFSLLFSIILTPFIPKMHVSSNTYTFVGMLIQEMFIGLILGFIIQIFFFIPMIAGDFISSQIGLSFSTIVDINNKLNLSIISNFFRIIYFLLFFSLHGHMLIISIIIKSFFIYPIKYPYYNLNCIKNIIYFFISSFIHGIILVLPIIILVLLVNIILAFLNRISPQISIFSISFPFTILVGIFSLYFFIPTFYIMFNQYYWNFFDIIGNLFNNNYKIVL
ncbi:flagellar biosynthetic protein FliR [Buchnera aphidicola]|uniref:Flagellar biosynthetic protein FliR n=1 Tax=Buchnera aphidicola (Anoecia oenotherae) TaxID=1241833 RepID=A0A4D6XR41_9GAMM|nr:flagellar biosynthetic protein FliR [Buchnera aphidicola]QCI19206.1 flagellar biosynthetic protein FliR [Buchnera aphidicola (Anoecia oenotherae)]